MLKNMRLLVSGFIVGILVFGGIVSAATLTKLDVSILPLKYFFDGIEKKPPANQLGFVHNGTTYVPLRFVSEALGKEVGWDGKTQSIYVGKQPAGEVTHLSDMKTHTKNEKQIKNDSSEYVTNIGVKYLRGILIGDNTSIMSCSSCYKYEGLVENEYLLNSGFSTFEALLAPDKSWAEVSKVDNIGNLEIFVDDKSVYKSGSIASDITVPIKVNVDISGALKIKISVKGYNLLLLEPKFIR